MKTTPPPFHLTTVQHLHLTVSFALQVHQDLQDLMECQDNLVVMACLDSQDLQVLLAPKDLLDHQEMLVHLELLVKMDDQECLEEMESDMSVHLDLLGFLVKLDSLETLELQVQPELQEAMERLDQLEDLELLVPMELLEFLVTMANQVYQDKMQLIVLVLTDLLFMSALFD